MYYNQPIMLELTPNSKGDMEQLKEYTHAEMKEFTSVCEQEGFGENAVVAKRGEVWRVKFCRNWGFVSNLCTYKAYNEVYKPILVKWADNTESKHWPEELFLIHKGMTSDQIMLIAEAQT